MKQWLACIFLAIFSFQVLPVKEIGKILFKGQMTEEVHDYASADAKVKKEADPYKLHHTEVEYAGRIALLTARTTQAIIETDRLPKHFIPDILTPPPNCIG